MYNDTQKILHTQDDLKRRVDEIERFLNHQERHDFKYSYSEQLFLQRRAKGNTRSGEAFSDWSIVPIIPTDGIGVNWGECNLGYSLLDNVVTITQGHLWLDTRYKIDIASASITIGSSGTWIYVEHVWGSTTATIKASTTVPMDDAATMKWPLSKWSYADGKASIAELCWIGDIKIPLVRP